MLRMFMNLAYMILDLSKPIENKLWADRYDIRLITVVNTGGTEMETVYGRTNM